VSLFLNADFAALRYGFFVALSTPILAPFPGHGIKQVKMNHGGHGDHGAEVKKKAHNLIAVHAPSTSLRTSVFAVVCNTTPMPMRHMPRSPALTPKK